MQLQVPHESCPPLVVQVPIHTHSQEPQLNGDAAVDFAKNETYAAPSNDEAVRSSIVNLGIFTVAMVISPFSSI